MIEGMTDVEIAEIMFELIEEYSLKPTRNLKCFIQQLREAVENREALA